MGGFFALIESLVQLEDEKCTEIHNATFSFLCSGVPKMSVRDGKRRPRGKDENTDPSKSPKVDPASTDSADDVVKDIIKGRTGIHFFTRMINQTRAVRNCFFFCSKWKQFLCHKTVFFRFLKSFDLMFGIPIFQFSVIFPIFLSASYWE